MRIHLAQINAEAQLLAFIHWQTLLSNFFKKLSLKIHKGALLVQIWGSQHFFIHINDAFLSDLSAQKFGNAINMVSMGMKLRFLYPNVTRVKINNRAFYTNVKVRAGVS